jgi:hypothetical protein
VLPGAVPDAAENSLGDEYEEVRKAGDGGGERFRHQVAQSADNNPNALMDRCWIADVRVTNVSQAVSSRLRLCLYALTSMRAMDFRQRRYS